MQTLFSSFILVLFQKIGIEAALYLSPLNLDIRKRYAFQLPQMEYTRFPGAADEPPRADAPTIISDYFAVYRFYVNDNNLLLVRRIIANVFGGTNIYAQSQSLRNEPKIYYSYTHSISNSSHNVSAVRD